VFQERARSRPFLAAAASASAVRVGAGGRPQAPWLGTGRRRSAPSCAAALGGARPLAAALRMLRDLVKVHAEVHDPVSAPTSRGGLNSFADHYLRSLKTDF